MWEKRDLLKHLLLYYLLNDLLSLALLLNDLLLCAQVWEEREALQVVIRVQELLMERGLETHEVVLVFKEFDSSGDGQLDSEEFKRALGVLGVRLPPSKVRPLFRT